MTEQQLDKLVEYLATYFYYLRKKIIPDPENADSKDLNRLDKCEKLLIELGASIEEYADKVENMDSLTRSINALQPPIIIYKGKTIGKNPVVL